MANLNKIIHNKKFRKFLLENDIAWLDIKNTPLLPFAISLFKTRDHRYTKFPLTNLSLLETFVQSNSHHHIKLKSGISDIDETLRFLKLIEAFPSEFDIPPVVGNYHVLCERFKAVEIESNLNEHLLGLLNLSRIEDFAIYALHNRSMISGLMTDTPLEKVCTLMEWIRTLKDPTISIESLTSDEKIQKQILLVKDTILKLPSKLIHFASYTEKEFELFNTIVPIIVPSATLEEIEAAKCIKQRLEESWAQNIGSNSITVFGAHSAGPGRGYAKKLVNDIGLGDNFAYLDDAELLTQWARFGKSKKSIEYKNCYSKPDKKSGDMMQWRTNQIAWTLQMLSLKHKKILDIEIVSISIIDDSPTVKKGLDKYNAENPNSIPIQTLLVPKGKTFDVLVSQTYPEVLRHIKLTMESSVIEQQHKTNLMNLINTQPTWIDFVKNFDEPNGFTWTTNPLCGEIYDAYNDTYSDDSLDSSGFPLYMRMCQRVLSCKS